MTIFFTESIPYCKVYWVSHFAGEADEDVRIHPDANRVTQMMIIVTGKEIVGAFRVGNSSVVEYLRTLECLVFDQRLDFVRSGDQVVGADQDLDPRTDRRVHERLPCSRPSSVSKVSGLRTTRG